MLTATLMLIVLYEILDDLLDKEKMFIKFVQSQSFRPVLLGYVNEKRWLNLVHYIYLDPVLLGLEKEKPLVDTESLI